MVRKKRHRSTDKKKKKKTRIENGENINIAAKSARANETDWINFYNIQN